MTDLTPHLSKEKTPIARQWRERNQQLWAHAWLDLERDVWNHDYPNEAAAKTERITPGTFIWAIAPDADAKMSHASFMRNKASCELFYALAFTSVRSEDQEKDEHLNSVRTDVDSDDDAYDKSVSMEAAEVLVMPVHKLAKIARKNDDIQIDSSHQAGDLVLVAMQFFIPVESVLGAVSVVYGFRTRSLGVEEPLQIRFAAVAKKGKRIESETFRNATLEELKRDSPLLKLDSDIAMYYSDDAQRARALECLSRFADLQRSIAILQKSQPTTMSDTKQSQAGTQKVVSAPQFPEFPPVSKEPLSAPQAPTKKNKREFQATKSSSSQQTTNGNAVKKSRQDDAPAKSLPVPSDGSDSVEIVVPPPPPVNATAPTIGTVESRSHVGANHDSVAAVVNNPTQVSVQPSLVSDGVVSEIGTADGFFGRLKDFRQPVATFRFSSDVSAMLQEKDRFRRAVCRVLYDTQNHFIDDCNKSDRHWQAICEYVPLIDRAVGVFIDSVAQEFEQLLLEFASKFRPWLVHFVFPFIRVFVMITFFEWRFNDLGTARFTQKQLNEIHRLYIASTKQTHKV